MRLTLLVFLMSKRLLLSDGEHIVEPPPESLRSAPLSSDASSLRTIMSLSRGSIPMESVLIGSPSGLGLGKYLTPNPRRRRRVGTGELSPSESEQKWSVADAQPKILRREVRRPVHTIELPGAPQDGIKKTELTPTGDTDTVMSSGEISIGKTITRKDFPETRTFDKSRCVMKMVCYLEKDEEFAGVTYGGQVARLLSDAWEKFHPRFLDRVFGYEEILSLGKSHSHEGCVLKYNSCPMSIINTVYLSLNLQNTANLEHKQ